MKGESPANSLVSFRPSALGLVRAVCLLSLISSVPDTPSLLRMSTWTLTFPLHRHVCIFARRLLDFLSLWISLKCCEYVPPSAHVSVHLPLPTRPSGEMAATQVKRTHQLFS